MTLALLCAAWLAGVVASATLGADAWPLAGALALAHAAWAVVRRDARLLLLAALTPAVFAAAIVREDASAGDLPPSAVAALNAGPSVRMRGVVRDDPDIAEVTQRFVVDVRTVQEGGAWRDAAGGVQVTAPLFPRYRAGDILELEGDPEPPPALDGFDYAEYLARRGVYSVLAFPQATRVGDDDLAWHRALMLGVRRDLARGLGLALTEPEASLAEGVLLGRRAALPPDVRDDLNATNTSHLVVVSGANVVYVSGFLTWLLTWLVNRRLALVLSVAGVLAYAGLVGVSPPVFRATIMGLVLVGARVSGRRTDGATSLLLAAAIMAGVDPPVVRDVSFQLSFAATAGILYLAHPLRRAFLEGAGWLVRRDELPRWCGSLLAEPFAVTASAVIATFPLLALNFERVSLIAMPANMLIVPLFPLILLASLLAALGGLAPWGHVVLGAPAQALLWFWLAAAHWFAALPYASASVGGYEAPYAFATYLALASLVLVAPRLVRAQARVQLAPTRPWTWQRLRPVAAVAVPAAALIVSAGFIILPDDGGRLRVTVLDVGQGDAILIQTPSGRDVLVDGGPGRALLRGLGDELPWHDRSLDLVVLTHAQADHAAGLVDVLARYDVRRVIAPAHAGDSALARAFADAIRTEGASAHAAIAGDSLDLGDGVRIDVLWPPANGAPAAANDASTVLRVTHGGVTFLLAADITAAAERALLASGADLQADVLKVAHHGSASSSSAAFIDAVAPSLAVISAGADNRFGHPAPAVLDRIATIRDVFVTARDGTVRIESDGERLYVDSDR